MQWFLKVQLASGGPGAEVYLDLTITYSFDVFIGYFFFRCHILLHLMLQPNCKDHWFYSL